MVFSAFGWCRTKFHFDNRIPMNRSIGKETKKIGRLAKVENENMKKLCCKKSFL